MWNAPKLSKFGPGRNLPKFGAITVPVRSQPAPLRSHFGHTRFHRGHTQLSHPVPFCSHPAVTPRFHFGRTLFHSVTLGSNSITQGSTSVALGSTPGQTRFRFVSHPVPLWSHSFLLRFYPVPLRFHIDPPDPLGHTSVPLRLKIDYNRIQSLYALSGEKCYRRLG